MTDPVIVTRGLRKTFGAKTAVRDLSLRVNRGEIFGFLGPNGAGKTTSVKMLLGLVPPTAGEATLLGRPLGDRRARAKVGFLPEHFRFQEWLTGREFLRFHGRLFGLSDADARAKIPGLLARVDLEDAADRPIRTYSKGMTQRIGLAQALMNDPDIVFLDEPTSGLDPLGRFLVRDIIKDLRKRGAAVFLNSHLLGEVETTCDRVVFVKNGVTVHELALGASDGGLDVSVRTGDLRPEARAVLARHDAAPEGAPADGPPFTFRLKLGGEAEIPELNRQLVARGVDVFEIRPLKKSLEAWFLEVMGDGQRPG